MAEEAGLDIDFDREQEQARAEAQALALQRVTDPELGKLAAVPARTVTLAGRQFRISAKVGLMPLLKFAHAADLDTSDLRGLAAMYEMLQDVIQEPVPPCGECVDCLRGQEDDCPFADKGDWDDFTRHATESKCDGEELLDVVSEAITLLTARPTESPTPSSGGPRRTTRNSTATSSARRAAGSGGSRRARRAM